MKRILCSCAVEPPSTEIVVPVIGPAASDNDAILDKDGLAPVAQFIPTPHDLPIGTSLVRASQTQRRKAP